MLYSVGDRIREYEIVAVLGRGGMGVVYHVRHIYVDVERALKIVLPDWDDFPKIKERFLREARIMSRLQHENLVSFHDFGELEDGSQFMVMEFVRGESIATLLESVGALPSLKAMRVLQQVCLGLSAAHRAGIVHRDISPDNILLTEPEDRVKVIDFGIAKPVLAGIGGDLTYVGMFLGKLEYCSPEQVGGLPEGEELDGRSDLYSLGITFYKMLTGRTPFQASSPQQFISKHLTELPKRPSELKPDLDLDPDIEALLMRLLAKDRNLRPSTAEEVAVTLERLQQQVRTRVWLKKRAKESGSIPVYPLEAVEMDAERAKSRALHWIISLLAIVALASGLAFYIRYGKQDVEIAGMQFVLVSPGKFIMGSGEGETLAHSVEIQKPFYITRLAVNRQTWETITQDGPASKAPDGAVTGVSWYETQSFFVSLNKKFPGHSFRLPTEAEWEYSCRRFPESVKNREWSSDWYEKSYYSIGDSTDPAGPQTGTYKVVRGFHADQKQSAECTARSKALPDKRFDDIGFRVVFVPK